jgi:hypothetical protein
LHNILIIYGINIYVIFHLRAYSVNAIINVMVILKIYILNSVDRRTSKEAFALYHRLLIIWEIVYIKLKKKLNSVAFNPQANYTDRATAACRRSWC